MRKIVIKALKLLAGVLYGIVMLIFLINAFVCISVKDDIYTLSDTYDVDTFFEIADLNAEVIIVPGCGIVDNKTPTHMLSDRLDVAIDLYNRGLAPKLLFSGDHKNDSHNEVAAMHDYAIERGVPEEDIILDHSGFSTSETMFRAKDVFGINKAIVVTQEYHLSRSLYLAKAAGIDVIGVCAEGHVFKGQLYYSLRELGARPKDFALCLLGIEPDID